jgi:hypothetical protein
MLTHLKFGLEFAQNWKQNGSSLRVSSSFLYSKFIVLMLAQVERRRQSIIRERRELVSSLYEIYKFSVPIFERAALPRPHDVQEFGGFMELIEAPTETAVKASDFKNAVNALPLLITQWAIEQRQVLLSLLPISDGSADHLESRLELATSVLKCAAPRSCTIPILCSEALVHTCTISPFASAYGYMACHSRDGSRVFAFWPEASDVVQDVASSLGLDPKMTTGDDLDHLGARLLCLICPAKISKNGKEHRDALTWRSCVSDLRFY